jgi:adenylate cyclase
MTDPIDLAAVLLDLGVTRAEIDEARSAGALELLALEKVVSLEDPRFDIDEVAALSGIGAERIREYWRALGFPDPRPGEKLFTEGDVEMMSAIMSFIAEGALEPDLAVQMARVIGSSLARIAAAQVDAIEARRTAEPGERSLASARATAEVLALMPTVMEYVWRRQLASVARRRMTRGTGEGGELVVGFADLVGFTAKTQQLREHELAEVVGRFEVVAFDVVAEAGGRVVKMIGDEVMFVHDDATKGAELALDLADTFRSDPNLSDVRVGLAYGPTLERDGDVYGPVVNLASRIVTIAYPGTVVVSEELFDVLRGDDRFALRSLRSHYLKDIGRVSLWALRRPGGVEAPYSHERRRRAARQLLLERWAELHGDPRQLATEEVLSSGLLEAGLGAVGGGEEAERLPTGQYEAITEAVLESDLEPELQVEVLGELEAARRLHRLEQEAQQKAAEADLEAERRLEEIEREAHRRVEEAEREARRKVEQALEEAEEKSRKVNEEATRKVQRVAEKAERQADRVEKEAKVEAERKAKRKKRGRDKPDKKQRD